jgi:hypothetical protein
MFEQAVLRYGASVKAQSHLWLSKGRYPHDLHNWHKGRGLTAISHMFKTIAMAVRSNQNLVGTQLRRARNVTITTLSCVERNNSRPHRCEDFMNVPASGLQSVGRTFNERVKDGIEVMRTLYNVRGTDMSCQNGNLRRLF